MTLMLAIDRTKCVRPEVLGLSVWRGSADGSGLIGRAEQDRRSLALSEVDLSRLRLVRTLKDGEAAVGGEENLRRLRALTYISLDDQVSQALWQQSQLLPDFLKNRTNGRPIHVYASGSTFRNRNGRCCLLGWCYERGKWDRVHRWLDGDWYAHHQFLMLEP